MDFDHLPQPNQNNLWYHYNDADAVLVFVHGVLSDSRGCWLYKDEVTKESACYWPDIIKSDARFKDVGIYLAGYHTKVDSGDFPIQQCAVEVYSYLKTTDPQGRRPVMDKNKIIFVCHSMGGIVARYLLCEQRDAFKDRKVGIVLIASPSYGSKVARSLDEVIYLYNHAQGKQLKWGNAILRDLDRRFKNLNDSKQMPGLSGVEFFENRFMIRWKWLPLFARTKIVTEESAARYFGDAKQIGGSDHSSICKPMGISDTVHQYLLEFLQDKDLLPSPKLPAVGAEQNVNAEAQLPDASNRGQAGLALSSSGEKGISHAEVLRGFVPPPPGLFIGRDEDLRDLKQRLGITSGRDATPMQPLIAIRGSPGVGKTTMTTALAHDPEVRNAFPHGVLWLPLGDKPNLLSVLARSGRALGSEDLLRSLTLKEAIAQLSNLLADKRILMIVDDVWEIEHVVPFQQARGVACTLVLTTREPQVAEALAPTPELVYNVPVLTEENGLKLLRALAPTVVDEHSKESLDLVRDLECLPLGLQVAGRLLNEEAKMGWGGVDKLLEQLRTGKKLLDAKAPADRMDLEKQTIPTVAVLLNQSTDRLDQHTRDCFARLGAFAPKPATFDLEDMKAVWSVEDPSTTVRTLVSRGLLEPLGGGRFQMHALLVLHADSMLTD